MTKNQFEYHTSGMITVNFLSDSEFLAHSTKNGNPDAHGWHLGKNGNITITFQASMFADKNINSFKFAHILNDPNNTITGTKQGYEINRVDVIQHEFGHGFAYYLFGDDYNSWNNNYKENWAYWYVNETYRIPNGMDTWAFQGRNFFNWFPFLYKGRNPVSNDLK